MASLFSPSRPLPLSLSLSLWEKPPPKCCVVGRLADYPCSSTLSVSLFLERQSHSIKGFSPRVQRNAATNMTMTMLLLKRCGEAATKDQCVETRSVVYSFLSHNM